MLSEINKNLLLTLFADMIFIWNNYCNKKSYKKYFICQIQQKIVYLIFYHPMLESIEKFKIKNSSLKCFWLIYQKIKHRDIVLSLFGNSYTINTPLPQSPSEIHPSGKASGK